MARVPFARRHGREFMNQGIWGWDDFDWGAASKTASQMRAVHAGNAKKKQGGSNVRFVGTAAHAEREGAALAATHPAVVAGRSVYHSKVLNARDSPRVLVSGHHNCKIGKRITKGPWSGLEVYTFALEERATCPSSCGLWRECYGNTMHLARRHHPGPDLIEVLGQELAQKARKHPKGFAVRLHVLGDFYDADYVAAWLHWMDDFPGMHVWGYTSHPMTSRIGMVLDAGNDTWPDRWSVRFSVSPETEIKGMTATTIWRLESNAQVREGLVCPAQQHRTISCSTCALCWSREATEQRIVFIGHGRRVRGPGRSSENETDSFQAK